MLFRSCTGLNPAMHQKVLISQSRMDFFEAQLAIDPHGPWAEWIAISDVYDGSKETPYPALLIL